MSEATGNRLEFAAGEVICKPGEKLKNIFLVESGEVGVFRVEKDHLYLQAVKSQAKIVGDDILFSEGREAMAAIAISDVVVSCIKIDEIDYVLERCPDWLGNILSLISDRLNSSRAALNEHKIVSDEIENYPLTADQLNSYRKSLNLKK